MNKFSFITFVFLTVLFFSCSKSDDSPDVPEQKIETSVDKNNLSILNGSSAVFKITASDDTKWKIEIPSAANEWLKVTPTEGIGTMSVNCSVSKDNEKFRIRRDANLLVKCNSRIFNVAIKDSLNNTPPLPTSAAIYPKDDSKDISDSKIHISWEESKDSEGDNLTYTAEYSTDKSNWSKLATNIKVNFFTGTFDLKPNTKYYWRIKTIDMFDAESAYSEIFSFTTANGTRAWEDGEVRLYQNCFKENATNPFTIIVTGDGFTEKDLAAGGNFETNSSNAIDGLLSNTEPYKTWGKYLRIYRIAAKSDESGVSEHKPGDTNGECLRVVKTKFGAMYDNVSSSAWCGMFDNDSPSTGGSFNKTFQWVDEQLKKSGINITQDFVVLVLLNTSHYNGSVSYFTTGNKSMGFVCLSPGNVGTSTYFINVVTHEIGGHGIGRLADLYTRAGTISQEKIDQTLRFQSYGWYQNVSVYSDKEKAPWAFFFKEPEYSKYYSTVGLFEGARSATKGIWRSENEPSCMNDNRFYYDAASRWSIVKRLKEAVGENLTWDEFVAKDYDRGNTNSSSRSINMPGYLPDLPEPTIYIK